MKAQRYYPTNIAAQILWLQNFGAKVAGYEVALTLPPALVDAVVASCNFAIYVMGIWLTAVRDFGPAATSAMDLLLTGSGPAPVALPVFTPPPLPAGVAPVPPGALNLIFSLVNIINSSPGMNDTIGHDLGIIGPAAPAAVATGPDIKLKLVQGAVNQAVNLGFHKHGHTGVYIESQRGSGTMEFLAIDTEIPYHDDRPLLVAGVPEVRTYRMRYWDKGLAVGDWSATISITVGP